MLGKPEMNLPGTSNFHDKSMQTTGVVLTAAHPSPKYGFLPGGRSLKSNTYFLPFLLTILTLRPSLPLRTQSQAIQEPFSTRGSPTIHTRGA